MMFKHFLEEIDTFDAYYKNVFMKKNKLIIPYINLGVSEHPLNMLDKLLFINFSYVVFTEIFFLKKNGIIITNKDKGENFPSIYLGGINLDVNNDIIEIEVKAESAYLQLIEKSELSENNWFPIDGLEKKRNLVTDDVEKFFNGEFMPSNLKGLIDSC